GHGADSDSRAADVLAPCAQEVARRVEFVNAVVAEVRGVDAPARVDRNTLRGIELAAQSALAAREAAGRDGADPNAGTADVLAPRAQEVARRVELVDPPVDQIGGVDVPARVSRDTGRQVQLAAQPTPGARLAVIGDCAGSDTGTADVLAPREQEIARCIEL